MAGRIRSVKPELIEDAVTAALSHVAFRLFVGMIVMADDHGNLRAAPPWLQGQVFHGQPVTLRAIRSACEELARPKPGGREGLVVFYEDNGQAYAHLTGWHRHQRVDNANAPRLPLPPGWEAVEEKRTEGNRTRVRWISRLIAPGGAAPPMPSAPHGTAPPGAEPPCGAALGGEVGDVGAAGSRSRSAIPRGTTTPSGAAPPPPQAPPPTQDQIEILEELEKGTDVYPGIDLGPVAARLASTLRGEARADEIPRRQIGREIVAHVRRYAARYTASTPEQRIAEAEQKLVWLLREVYAGRFDAKPASSAASRDRRPPQDAKARAAQAELDALDEVSHG